MKRCAAIAVMAVLGASFWGAPKSEIILAAAASLKDAVGEAISVYEASTPGVKILPTYGSSGSLQKQIEQGAPVDVFIPASPKQMDALQAKGLIDPSTKATLLTNRVVLVVPKTDKTIVDFADAGTAKVRSIALGEPASGPAGQYAEQVFSSLGILDAVKPKAVYGKDVRQVLAYVEGGEVDAGVVYETDAAIAKNARIVAYAPAGSCAPVEYPVAAVTTGSGGDAAKAFIAWLSGPKASAIFKRYGFGTR